LKLLVCEEARFPPLKSPPTLFEAADSPKFSIVACCCVSDSWGWLFAFAAKAAGMTEPPAAVTTTDSAASKAVVLVDIILGASDKQCILYLGFLECLTLFDVELLYILITVNEKFETLLTP
jgi:hypothetical protein